MLNSICDVPGIKVGHAQDMKNGTGCTVIAAANGAVTGYSCTGGAPGTRELSCLAPENLVKHAHAVYLGGGSAFGLDGACGVMQYLEEKGIGFDTGFATVPIVPGAILYDLLIGNPKVRPDREMGYLACCNMSSDNAERGCVGAGTGASIGIAGGPSNVMKGGLGTASIRNGDLVVGVIIAVNSLGDVIDPKTGEILAGALDSDGNFRSVNELMRGSWNEYSEQFMKNTTIGVVATNADLTKAEAKRVAMVSHDGMARAINPSHTTTDGDTMFCMSTGGVKSALDAVCVLAADATSLAIIDAVKSAVSMFGVKSYSELHGIK